MKGIVILYRRAPSTIEARDASAVFREIRCREYARRCGITILDVLVDGGNSKE